MDIESVEDARGMLLLYVLSEFLLHAHLLLQPELFWKGISSHPPCRSELAYLPVQSTRPPFLFPVRGHPSNHQQVWLPGTVSIWSVVGLDADTGVLTPCILPWPGFSSSSICVCHYTPVFPHPPSFLLPSYHIGRSITIATRRLDDLTATTQQPRAPIRLIANVNLTPREA